MYLPTSVLSGERADAAFTSCIGMHHLKWQGGSEESKHPQKGSHSSMLKDNKQQTHTRYSVSPQWCTRRNLNPIHQSTSYEL